MAKSLAPVYLVAGPEPLLVQESRDLIIHAAREHGFLERTVYETDGKFNWDIIGADSQEQSLFSHRKLVDIRLPGGKPGKSGGDFFCSWVQSPDPDQLLLVSCETWEAASRKSKWAAELGRAGVLVEIWAVRPHELPNWIQRRMGLAGLKPEPEAVRLLAGLVEGNLLAAQQEIEKLALLEPGAVITAESIQRSVANSTRFDAFRLGECLLNGQADESLRVADGLRRTGIAIQAVGAALTFQLGQLQALHRALQAGESETRAFSRLRIFKLAQPSFRAALRRVSGAQIRKAFCSLALLDRQGKGRAEGDPWQTLDLMVLDMCA